MQRRDVLKLLGSAVAISALPAEALALLQAASGRVGHAARRAMDAHQDATVTAIAEMIIPATDTPGAKGAKVNEFIDLLLAEWYEPEEARKFLEGVKGVDTESQKLYGKNFIDCASGQQVEMLTRWDKEAVGYARGLRTAVAAGALLPEKGNQNSPAPTSGETAAPGSVPAGSATGVPVAGQAPKPAVAAGGGQTDAGIAMGTSGGAGAAGAPVNFFYLMKKLTLTGYYTSQVGFEQELKKSIIPASHAGCAPVAKVGL